MDKEISLLIVDDDSATLRVLSRILSDYSDQRLATSGEQAIALLHARTPDLMLIDMEMPGISGTHLCALVKSDPMLAHVPVLFVTSDDTEPTRLEALELGAADFVTKPISAEQLRARVAAVLRTSTELERAKEEVASAPSLESPVLRPGPARLLLLGGDNQDTRSLRDSLTGIGEIRPVEDVQTALELMGVWRPDLVLVDADSAGADGLRLCESLKATYTQSHVPIVFSTGAAGCFDDTLALALGAADIVGQPHSPAVLRARVRNLLELKRRTDIELAMVAAQGQRLATDRLAAVVEGASDAIITLNSGGCIALMNAAAGRLMKLDPQRVSGTLAARVLEERLPGLDLTRPTSARRVLLQYDGLPPTPAEVSISTVGEGSLRLTTLMFRDLTDRERLEAESSARVAAEAANRTKALMMSYVAHEIGNPLNCILGFAQLLGADRDSPLTHSQAQRVAMIEAGCTQLTALMNDLSALGHFELGQLPVVIQPFAADKVVESALLTTSGLAQQTGIQLRLDSTPTVSDTRVLGDSNRLRQCLVNLLSNGIKYNTRGGGVAISLHSLQHHLEIKVSDSGIGMTEEQISHLFEPFNRLGREGGRLPGTGLGLVVTRQLIEAMGGQMSVTSRSDEGSCFTLRLPLVFDAGGRR